MKAKTNTVLMGVALLAYLVGLSNASAFYDPCMQRWLNRDPIGEKGVLNLYGFTLNNPNTWVDPYGLSTICFNIGFDTSAQATRGNIAKLQRSLKNLSGLMSKCCQKYGIGCGVNVSAANYDWNQNAPPNGGSYDNNATVPSISGSQNCIPVLVTTLPISVTYYGSTSSDNGIAPPSGGIILNITSSTVGTLAHETGHVGGYDQGDAIGGNGQPDNSHSGESDNPMYTFDTAGQNPDECYCKKVANLAK